MSDGTMELRMLAKGLELLGREVSLRLAKQKPAPRAYRGRVTPKLRLHGRYIGLMRPLPARKRAQVKRIREKFGVQRAIKLARRLREA